MRREVAVKGMETYMRTFIIISVISLCLMPFFGGYVYGEILSLKKVSFEPGSFRNPFKPLLPEKKIEDKTPRVIKQEPEVAINAPDINIQGVVWGGKFPQAIINGSVLKEGDTLAGKDQITILQIRQEEIVVLYKGKVFNLSAKIKKVKEE